MHELTICQSLLAEVERIVSQNGAVEAAEIIVQVGPLSGVEPGLLQRTFQMARIGTVAARAALKIETGPVVVWCGACDRETTVVPNALLCGDCGGWKVRLRAGDELLLKRLFLAADPIAA
jgi:hydrogenase nickel incorporation protein HypA/HybF